MTYATSKLMYSVIDFKQSVLEIAFLKAAAAGAFNLYTLDLPCGLQSVDNQNAIDKTSF